MRSFAPVLLLASVALTFSAFAGCGDGLLLEPSNTSSASSTASSGSGLSTCNNGAPNGACNPAGQYPEPCSCSDCEATAICTGRCNDDGVCSFNPETYDGTGEDCTCGDCYYKVNICAPFACDEGGNCDCDFEDPACTVSDACACPDCIAAPACNDCVDNGVCVPFNESCACADCADDVVCGGMGPASSSSSGMGGSGGEPGTGGAGGSGGTPSGAGGAGGAGGA